MTYYDDLKLHLDSMTDVPEAAQSLLPVASELDERLQFLANEPPSENTRLAALDARRKAAEKAQGILDATEQRFAEPIGKARDELFREPEPDRFHVQRFWSSLPEGYDSLMIEATWDTLSEFQRDALMIHPDRIIKDGEGYRSAPFVSPELREREYRSRRPEAAQKFDRLTSQAEAMRLAGAFFLTATKASARDTLSFT